MREELLSALDVTNRVFRRTLRGFDPAEVDEFLDHVSDTIQTYAERVREQETTMDSLKEQMQEYQRLRDSMQEALIMAQKSAEERVTAAEQQAQTIIGDAHSKAEGIVQKALGEAEGIRKEMSGLREKRASMIGELRGFMARLGSLLEHQEEQGENLEEILSQMESVGAGEGFSSQEGLPLKESTSSLREGKDDALHILPPGAF